MERAQPVSTATVSHRLIDPSKYADRRIFVVGGGDSAMGAAIARDASGALLPTTTAFWFAWLAFYPKTIL